MDVDIVVTFSCIAPIGHEHAAICRGQKTDAAEPGIVCFEQVWSVPGYVTRPTPFERVIVDTVPMGIERKKGVPVTVRPMAAEIDHRSAMGMATASSVVLGMFRAFVLPP